jgi:hypothetical protein
MRVLPITRVCGAVEKDNVSVANALTGLKLAVASLKEALAPCFAEARDSEEEVPHLLIVDQFEEIFTFRPDATGQTRWNPLLLDHGRHLRREPPLERGQARTSKHRRARGEDSRIALQTAECEARWPKWSAQATPRCIGTERE